MYPCEYQWINEPTPVTTSNIRLLNESIRTPSVAWKSPMEIQVMLCSPAVPLVRKIRRLSTKPPMTAPMEIFALSLSFLRVKSVISYAAP